MSDTVRFTIDEDLSEAMGTILPNEKSPLSLLRPSGRPVTGEMMSRLRSAGIIDESGKIRGEYRHAAETLAGTRQFSRLKFSGGEKIFEFIVYFPRDNSVPVSVIHNNDQLIIQEPAAFEEAFALVDQNVGHSILASCTFNAEISHTEAMALFALIDLERSSLLSALAQESEPHNAVFSPDAVMKKITGRKEHFQSLEFVIQSRILPATLPEQTAVASALTSLARKGLIIRNGENCLLSDMLYAVAGRFLIIDNFVVVETGRLDNDGNLWGGSFLSLQAGITDLLYLEVHGDTVIVKCITGFELMNLTDTFMSDPSLVIFPEQVSSGSSAEKPSTGSSKEKICPHCGVELKEGKKFCSNCGAKVS